MNQVDRKSCCKFCNPIPELLIGRTSSFAVLYDPFPVKPGHLLIISQEHCQCNAHLDSKSMIELLEVKSMITKVLEKQLKSVICYENRKSETGHLILHIIPFNEDVKEELSQFLPRCINGFYNQAPTLFGQGGNYIYYEDKHRDGFFYPIKNERLPSHLLRTLISQRNGTPNRANWENYYCRGVYEASRKVYSKENFKSLRWI